MSGLVYQPPANVCDWTTEDFDRAEQTAQRHTERKEKEDG